MLVEPIPGKFQYSLQSLRRPFEGMYNSPGMSRVFDLDSPATAVFSTIRAQQLGFSGIDGEIFRRLQNEVWKRALC